MKITPQLPRWTTAILTMSLLASLTACGGGGGSGSSSKSQALVSSAPSTSSIAPTSSISSTSSSSSAPADTTPDTFTAASITNAALNAEVTSATVTVTGINQPTPISISGGTYSINGGAYTEAAGTISNGQTITVKLTASDKTNTTVSATLTVGDVSGQFSVTTVPDVAPDDFSFTAMKDVTPNSVNTSDSITLAGVDAAVPISITGGEYAIDNGSYTSAEGVLGNGQKVTVRLMASDKTNTATSATLTIGGVSGQFTVTTAPDVTPDAFSFAAVKDVVPGSTQTSAAITVAGVDVAVPISISGGEYSIDNGAFTSTAGTVSSGQTVTVRATASDKTTTNVVAALTIGGVDANYTITTLADTQAPTAQILFPPPVSATEGNTILVRGTASDDYSAITSVIVNGVTATTTDGFRTWQALVLLSDSVLPLTKETDNTIKVTTEDSQGNKSTDASHVAIRQSNLNNYFPDDKFTFNEVFNIALDRARNRLLVTDDSNVTSVDLSSGQSTIFTPIIPGLFAAPEAMAINAASGRVYIHCGNNSNDRLFDFNLLDIADVTTHANSLFSGDSISSIGGLTVNVINGSTVIAAVNDYTGTIFTTTDVFSDYKILSSASLSKPDNSNPINHSFGIAFDGINQRYLVNDYSQQVIFSVDAVTGARKVFSSNTVGNGASFGPVNDVYLAGITVEESKNRALVAEAYSGKIFAVDLTSGDRTLFTSTTPDNPFNALHENYGIVIVDPDSYALVGDRSPNGILAIDMVTGHRVYLSK